MATGELPAPVPPAQSGWLPGRVCPGGMNHEWNPSMVAPGRVRDRRVDNNDKKPLHLRRCFLVLVAGELAVLVTRLTTRLPGTPDQQEWNPCSVNQHEPPRTTTTNYNGQRPEL